MLVCITWKVIDMPTSKEIQGKLKKGVDDAIAARNKTRQPPALANLARLPGDNASLLALLSMARKARDHLQKMVGDDGHVFDSGLNSFALQRRQPFAVFAAESVGVLRREAEE